MTAEILRKPCASDDCFVIREPLGSTHEDDVADGLGLLESGDGMGHDWLVVERGEELVEAHALAAAAGDDDRGEHESR